MSNKSFRKEKLIERHKKKIILVTIMTIGVLIGLIGTTFAMFIASDSSNEQEMYKVGDLNIAFEENTSSKINLANQYPMTDEAGLKITPHTFTLTNNGDYNVSYNIKIINSNTNLSTTKIKYSINASAPALLSSAADGIDIGTLIPKEKKTFELRLWIDENASTTDANKTYTGTIQVNGQAVRVPYFKDTSGANSPMLTTGLIPVVYDGVNEAWVIADTSKGWYAYQDQVWANAVTVSDETLRNAEVGTLIPMEKINSMWVWIPRYKYQIPSNIGSSSNVKNPPQMDIVFENNIETTGVYSDIGVSGYYTHPAFRNGTRETLLTPTQQSAGGHTGWDKEITGIWVGKFETGGSTDTPLIKPDIISLRSQNASSQFTTSLKFSGGTMDSNGNVTFAGNTTYGLTSTTDTHMMKNTEWGAVTYLSQSKYGKNGNENYSGTNKEVYKNDSSSYYTGRSGGTPNDGYTSYGTYSYDGKICNSSTCTGTKDILKGTGASTTGTIYGIYDMSGGANEYTMGNWAGTTNSDFNKLPINEKYYDKYTGISSTTITKDKSIKGDAEYETMKWYSDISDFASSSYPWVQRGGSYIDGADKGIFNSSGYSGEPNSNCSFRVTLVP